MNLKNYEYGILDANGEVTETNMKGDSIWPSISSVLRLASGLMKKNNDNLKTIELDFTDFILLLVKGKEKTVCVKLKDKSQKATVLDLIKEL